MKLSIIIPVYNEENTISQVIEKVENVKIEKEIIVVNDGSSDRTGELLGRLKKKYNFLLLTHKKNQGKGAAIQTALNYVKGDMVIVQDGDLETDPNDYLKLIRPILEGETKIVYGSRNLLPSQEKLGYYCWGGKFLTWLTNILYGSHLTDMTTCYKLFKTEILKNLELESRGFEFDAEVTAKVLKKNYSIVEVPIKYKPRTFKEGKKLRIKDGLKEAVVLLKYKFKRN